ncbi:FAD-dependent oxidoreductase [Oscillatoria sp. FACHB-1407]|uniref:NAD(P)/FAD-dependent oxidoreductase n=1 Tax=Oscillatoria sp. FACHB-1407 TaxID=2692847 RepID=UPI00168400F3|nr:FAD-dependent oxidoreductase [Oscillatoria sp. FACHB-1407]MBD2462592.1 FAD-dependent oxidoreductase [Oscillatoria sp. FACHB-1407]
MARSPLFRTLSRLLQAARSEAAHSTQSSPQSSAIAPRLNPSRRRFLKYSALAGAGAIATSAIAEFPRLQGAMGYGTPKVAIVGGGIAGLNAAYQLKKAGIIATVYEAKPYVGGRIQSQTVVSNNLVNDLGGSFINTDHEDILALAQELGLELFNRIENADQFAFPESAYYFDNKMLSEADLIDLLRPLADQLVIDAALLDEDFDTYAPEFDQRSVADYLDQHRDKITAPVVRRLAENAIRTEYGVEPEDSSALQLLYTVLLLDGDAVTPIGSDETYFIQGGSGKLIEGLARALPGQIRANLPLTELRSHNNGFQLTFGTGLVVDADYVILALPFMALRRVNLQVELPDTLRRFINEVNLGTNEKLFAGFNQRSWHQEQGFVGEAWTDLGYSQVWEETQRQPDQLEGALTFFLGGQEARPTRRTVERQGQQFVHRLNKLIPGTKAVATGQFYRTNWASDPYIGGGYTSFRPGQYLEFGEFLYIESDDPEERQDVYVGNLVFAGEHLSDEFYGYMNGGAQTGRLAAEIVSHHILVSQTQSSAT